MAIDLGTANTLIYLQGKGIVLEQPSVVALETESNELVAVGEEAKSMLGRTGDTLRALKPLKDGVITNATATMTMLRQFLAMAKSRRISMRPRVLVCVPSGITEVEVSAVKTALERAGAREVLLVPEPLASAIGVGIPVEGAAGNMVVDIGGGTTEVAVISLSTIAANNSIRVGGDELDEAIAGFLKKQYSLLIGERTAETVKLNLGNVFKGKEREMEVNGLDFVNGIPETYLISSEDVRTALKEVVATIVEAVRHGLEKTPPELASDIVDRGIVLTGGGALLRGLDRLLMSETGLPIRIADNPLSCTVLGAGIILEDVYRYRNLLIQ
ncbi:MAG: MreB/Mrl family cell shape determining protein [Candidatus Aegiribacteria sp.]|nr:MreB/Mrl family cell shape determining protein [Candidatus Aegiribacteria sp.]MBD3295022.1 MreB/Mrl family cell shape determining protein [Candidatus Fermentibacteria bacterium]